MDDHCHCPPMDHCDPPLCEQQDSSWDTAHHHHHHCHPPCPPPPPPLPPYEQQDYFWDPAFRPAFNSTPLPGTWSSSSSDAGASCTVRVEAPLLESKAHGGGAAGPSATEVLFGLLFWAAVAGFVYWYWFC